MTQIAVVTGSLKGLGYETAKGLLSQGYKVVITGRDEERGRVVEKEMKSFGDVSFIALDVSNPSSVDEFAAKILKNYESIDVLVNNAGIFPDREDIKSSGELSQEMIKAYTTNAVGPMLLIQKILPVMQRQKHGRIVNVSSGMGQLSHMGSASPAYRMSKVALNGVTRYFYATVKDSDILINSVCPGWVKTDMGGASAPRTIEQGASGILWAATLPKGGPNGGFFRDGKALEF
ncbi:MAG: SDR family NAD(P)-dependent oxidoreductase [Proteobacteria bacterium]|nr:MAG: SDR family NAD(P)-dependent oxidoreductase [Pseudomonadota bacterium]